LVEHHKLYSQKCKAEFLEELFSKSLIDAGFGSDWKPNANHKQGTDQTTSCGYKISNKSGKLTFDNIKTLHISGSRLGSHKTLNDKLEHLKKSPEDYVVCVATNDKEWKKGKKTYYLVVINAKKLDYSNVEWKDTLSKKGTISGHICEGKGYKASITYSLSHQLWTSIQEELFEEYYEIII